MVSDIPPGDGKAATLFTVYPEACVLKSALQKLTSNLYIQCSISLIKNYEKTLIFYNLLFYCSFPKCVRKRVANGAKKMTNASTK